MRDECVACGSGDKRKRKEEGTGLSDDDEDLAGLSEEFLNQNKRKELFAQVKAWLQKILGGGLTKCNSSRTRPKTVDCAIEYVNANPDVTVTFIPRDAAVRKRLTQAFSDDSNNVTITGVDPHAPAVSSQLAERNNAFAVTA